MSRLNLIKGGLKTFNVLYRPQSTFMGRVSTVSRNQSILFQQTSKQNLVQPKRSYIRGPDNVRDEKAGKHWTVERYLAIGLLGIIPASLVLETAVTDYLLAGALVQHAKWGCHSIIIDYLHGPVLPKLGLNLLTAAAILSFIGLCYFNYTDVGLAKAVKKVWSL